MASRRSVQVFFAGDFILLFKNSYPGVHKLKRGVPESIRFAERSPPRSALAGGVEGTGQEGKQSRSEKIHSNLGEGRNIVVAGTVLNG